MSTTTERPGSSVLPFRQRWAWHPAYWWRIPLGLQWLALIAFNVVQYQRFALTHDFAFYWQAVWLIAHGHLNPYSTIAYMPVMASNFELIIWPISLLYWFWPSASLLLYIQDTILVSAEWIAWIWMQSIIQGGIKQTQAIQLKVLGLILLIANPWVYSTAAFDFHSEPIIALALIGASYAIYRRNLRALTIWGIISLACGDVGSLLIVSLAITAIFSKQRKIGVVLALSGLSWLFLIDFLHMYQEKEEPFRGRFSGWFWGPFGSSSSSSWA